MWRLLGSTLAYLGLVAAALCLTIDATTCVPAGQPAEFMGTLSASQSHTGLTLEGDLTSSAGLIGTCSYSGLSITGGATPLTAMWTWNPPSTTPPGPYKFSVSTFDATGELLQLADSTFSMCPFQQTVGTLINGQCGSANGTAAMTKPNTNLCLQGTASTVIGTGPWNWTCLGSNGGTTASCATIAIITGMCGSANGQETNVRPTSNLCNPGTASAVMGSNPWNWTCSGTSGTTVANCMTIGPPVNTALPSVTPATPAVGQPETTTNGNWTNNPTTFSYQWKYGSGAPIVGATGTQYSPVTADGGNGFEATVTAANLSGSASATSNPTGILNTGNSPPTGVAVWGGPGTTYYVSAAGSDSNNGLSKATAWLHAPGMPNCTGVCASTVLTGGQNVVLRGGDTWDYGNTLSPTYTGGTWTSPTNAQGTPAGCNLESYSAPVHTNCIYFGNDQTWFVGTAWTRPIMNLDNPTSVQSVASCTYEQHNFIAIAWSSYTISDDFEFTGLCVSQPTTFGAATYTKEPGIYVAQLNHYCHGWTENTSGGPGTDEPACVFGTHGAGPSFNVHRFMVVDGWDTFCQGNNACEMFSFQAEGYDLDHSYVARVSNGIASNTSIFSVHDNLFENIYESWDGFVHGNVAESNAIFTSDIPSYFYNNIMRNTNIGVGVWLEPYLHGYWFNNIIFNNANPGNAGVTDSEVGQSTVDTKIFNNTVIAPDTWIRLSSHGNYPGTLEYFNNHFIGYSPAALSSVFSGTPIQTPTDSGGEVFQTAAAAAAQGYVMGNNFAPTASTNATIFAGIDITSICNGMSDATASNACQHGNTAVSYNSNSHTVVLNDNAPTRSPGGTDVGAYQFMTGGIPVNTTLPMVTPAAPIVGSVESTTNGTWLHSPTSYSYQWQYGADGPNNIFTKTLTGSASGWTGYNLANIIASSDLASSPGDTQIRVTFSFNSGNSGTTIDEAWIGEQATSGNAYNFDGTQVQLLFNGATSLAGIGASATVVTDWVNFSNYTPSKNLVVRLHVSGANPWLNQQGTTSETYYYLAGASQAGVTAPTGTWTVESGWVIGIVKIEMQYPGPTNITGAVASTYTPVSADTGHTLQAAVVASNSGGSSAPATSLKTSAVAASSACTNIPGTSTPVGAACIARSSFPALTSPVDPRVTYGADPTGATNSASAFQSAANATGHDIHVTCPSSSPCTYMISDGGGTSPAMTISRNVNVQCDANVTLYTPDHHANWSGALYFNGVTGGSVAGCNFLGGNSGVGPLHFNPNLWGAYLLLIADSSGLLIEGNTFGNTWSDGALYMGYRGGSGVSSTTVQFNTFTANPVYGAVVVAGGSDTIQNNLFTDSEVGVESNNGYPFTGNVLIKNNEEIYVNGGCNAAGDTGCNFVVGFTGGQLVDGFTGSSYTAYGTNTVSNNYVTGSNANGASGILNAFSSYITSPPTYTNDTLGPGGICQLGGTSC